MGCFGRESGCPDYDTGDSDEFRDGVCLKFSKCKEEEYIHVPDRGCVFGGVEGDLALGNGFPSVFFGINFARDEKDFLQGVLFDGFFKLS